MNDGPEETESLIFFRNDFRIVGFAEVCNGKLEIGGMSTIDIAIISKDEATRLIALIERTWPDVRTSEVTRLRKLVARLWHELPPAERRALDKQTEMECVAIAEEQSQSED